jgi:hypothetical protein
LKNTEELYTFMADASATLDLHVEESENAGLMEQQDVSIIKPDIDIQKKFYSKFCSVRVLRNAIAHPMLWWRSYTSVFEEPMSTHMFANRKLQIRNQIWIICTIWLL